MAQGDNNGFNIAITVAVVGAAAWGLWYFFQVPVLAGLRWLRYAELHLVSLFTSKFDSVIDALPGMKIKPRGAAPQGGLLDGTTLWNISAALGDIMRWPVALGLFGGLGWVLFHAPNAKYKQKYDLEGLMRAQVKMWPAISPIVGFDPSKTSARVPGSPIPAELPAFAESLAPDEWVAWAQIPVKDGEPDKEGVRQAFIQQLGPRWEGLTGLKPHHRALVAAFAVKGAQRRKESDDLLGQIAQCWTHQKGFVMSEPVRAQVDKVLNDRALIGPALAQAGKHAYRATALLRMLQWAREQGGVLAPAQFVWLRGQDRALWYPLNNLGRRSFHAEAAGAMAHYLAERAADRGEGRALPMPRVDTAVQPVLDYVQGAGGRIPTLSLKQPKPTMPRAAKGKTKTARA